MKSIKIGNLNVGEGISPMIVAEISANHNQSFEQALRLVEAAAGSGCHAVKLQTYTADTMTIAGSRDEFFIRDKESLWEGKSLYDLYREAYTPWEWHAPLLKRCRELGILGFSTPFDPTAVDFLESLQVPAYKIGSFENVDIPLLKKVASTGKPVILSTGMASIEELDEAVSTLRNAGNEQIILLKCTSSYPSTPHDSNLKTIQDMKQRFEVPVGLSDHTLGIGVSVAATALGACMIEKHFTFSREEGGVDSAFSMEPAEMKLLVSESLRAFQAIGEVHYGATEKEKKSLQFRRSIYIVQDMKKDELFTSENTRIIRPGCGLAPKYLEQVLGKKAKEAIRKGTPLSWDLVR